MAELRVATTTSGGSIMGLITLERGLRRVGVKVTRHEEDALKEGGLPEGADIGLLHNTLSVSDAVMRRSVVFALQTVVNKLSRSGKLRRRVLAAPPIEFWCNTESAARVLRGMGFAAVAMYRPAPSFEAPAAFAPLPEARRVLWYYDPPHRFMKSKLPVIKELLERVDDDVEVLLFPSEDCPVERANVRALGRIDLGYWVPRVRGMVRVSDHLDYGRSTFDVLAHGRWVLYCDMDEPINHSVATPEEIPGRLSALLEEEGEAEARARFEAASRFELNALAPVWADRLRAVLETSPEAERRPAPEPAAAAPAPEPAPAPAAKVAPPAPQGAHLDTYDADFYAAQADNSYKAAGAIVPLIQELVPVGSVCDVGCGAGTWLKVWDEQGVTDQVGMEGGHVEDSFRVPADRLVKVDLSRDAPSLREVAGRRFDLATSLEVAEHLPPERAASFVRDLCELADTVVFSAAIPGQGGKGHLNEQWQSWWVGHFNDQGYGAQDLIRPRIWARDAIRYWYRQNLLVFRKGAGNDRDRRSYDLVHPWAWNKKVKKLARAS